MDQKVINHIVAQAFLDSYISVAHVDLTTGETFVIKMDKMPEIAGTKRQWSDLIKIYEQYRVYPPDAEILRSITLENLQQFAREGRRLFPLEIRCISENAGFQWIELSAAPVDTSQETLLITSRSINEQVLMRRIVDLFVYRHYDYLLLIDAKRDSYLRLNDDKGTTPIPPGQGSHYTEDMIRFNRQYVAAEDRERVTANMQLSNVIRKLEKSEVYSFQSGGITAAGKYRRSQVSFLYYDKMAGLILCARTDVTQIYLEEQEKNRQLSDALRNAQQDALTGVYNQKATAELVKRSLESQYHNTTALYFIDVDNFKQINDTFGHQKGDELLCFLAQYLREIAGRDGIAGRLGGDEFLLYLPDISSLDKIEAIAQKICNFSNTLSARELTILPFSCSVGIAVYPNDGIDYDALLYKADQKLYTSKRNGRNRYSF